MRRRKSGLDLIQEPVESTSPLAQKMGFLKEEGIEAEVIRLSSGVAVPALTSGDADYYTPFLPYGQRSKAFQLRLLLLIYKAVSRHS